MPRFLVALVPCLLCAAAAAQLATSPNARLDALEFDGATGGASSLAFAVNAALPWVSGSAASATRQAELGLLAGYDPFPATAPLVYGLAPWFGTRDGGTAVLLSGMNLQKQGAAASLAVSFDLSPATNLSVLSNTQAALVTPAGPMGPVDVRATTIHGGHVLDDGYVYTPAVIAAPTAAIGGSVAVRDVGPTPAPFELYTSPFTTTLPLPPYGVLLIGPASVFKVAKSTYPASGVHTAVFAVPNDPLLFGVAFHFQAVAVLSVAPLTIVLTNRSSTLFQ